MPISQLVAWHAFGGIPVKISSRPVMRHKMMVAGVVAEQIPVRGDAKSLP